jgi:hypothetical protein
MPITITAERRKSGPGRITDARGLAGNATYTVQQFAAFDTGILMSLPIQRARLGQGHRVPTEIGRDLASRGYNDIAVLLRNGIGIAERQNLRGWLEMNE